MKRSTHPPATKVEPTQGLIQRNGLSSLLNNLAVVAIAVLASSATLTYAQNVLVNSGFESGATNWVNMPPWLWNGPSFGTQTTNDYVYSVPQQTVKKVTIHGGTTAFKIWGYFQSYAETVGAMQTFPCSPGSSWAAAGWASTQTPDNMTAAETSYIEVQFLDATTNVILGFDNTSPTMTAASPVNTWSYFEVVDQLSMSTTNLVAPSGTAFVRFLIRFYQSAGNPGGSCYWDDVALVRTSKPDPEITVQPSPVTLVYGQTATFSLVADGQTPLTYKWQKDGSDITNPNAHGVNTDSLSISNITTADVGNYTCTVTDQAGPLTSDPAYLSLNDPGIISITPAVGQTVTNGGMAHFSVVAAGSSALSYQWQFNGNPLNNGGRISGALSSALTIGNASAADDGTYTVLVDGGAAQASASLNVAFPSATNLLNNPGFEYGVLGYPWESDWSGFGGAGLVTTNSFYYDAINAQPSTTPVSVYDGDYACEVYVAAGDNGVYQANVPAMAGGT
jgi:Immunoglobulin domain/Immunoglobulin I-set domain